MVKDEIKIIFQEPETINIKTNEENDKFNIDLKDKISFDIPVEHNNLLNLDYENSGHIGFASEKALNELRELLENSSNEELEQIKIKIDNIEKMLASDDLDLDTLQELVNALKNNTSNITDIFNVLANKVDKVEGKQLSTNDLTNELLEKLNSLNNYDDTNIQKQIDDIKLILTTDDVDFDTLQELVNALKNNVSSIADIFQLLNRKVEKIEGKGLSTNDFTNEEKQKLAGLNNYDDTELRDKIDNTYTKNETQSLINNVKPNINFKTLVGQDKEYNGTAVPNDAYVEKVYFNKSLNVNQITNILSSLTYYQTPFLEYPINPILFANDGSQIIFVAKSELDGKQLHTIYATTDITNPEKANVVLNTGLSNGELVIIRFDITEYEVNKSVINDYSGIPIGTENSKLTNLFSATPFEEETQLYELNADGTINKDKPINIGDDNEKIDLSKYYTKEETNELLKNVEVDLTDYATLNDLENKADKSELFNKDYNELINKPTIPTNNNQLTNGAGYITNSALIEYAKKSELPTKVSELTNDSGYLTSIPTEYVTETELNELLETKEDKVNLKALAYKDSLNKEDVGLGNVLNVASYSKTEMDTELEQIRKSIDELSGITGDTEIELQNYYTKTQTNELLSLKSNISDLGALAYKNGLTKSDVGLNNVDNTSDLNKPISIATQNALDDKEDKSNLKSLAYKDNLSKEEIGLGNVNNVAITQEEVTQIGVNKTNIENTNNQLNTNTQNIIGLQTEVNNALNIAKGRSKTTVFNTLSDMTTYLKNANNSEFNLGDNLLIKATNVPDYWISNVLENNIGDYGYYEISILETTKVDLSNYYNKGEVDIKETNINNKINEKANLSDVYTKTQINSAFSSRDESITSLEQNKANKSDIPTKVSQLTNDSGFITSIPSEYVTETELDTKADKVDVYTKTEIDNSFSTRDTNITNISNKANTNATNIENLSKNKEDKSNLKALAYKDSLTKSDVGLDKVNNVTITSNQVEQIGTNATEISSLKTLVNTNETDIEKKVSDINTQIDNIKKVLSSDDTDYDTLQELVNALKNNVSSISDLFTQIATKVDKVSGKGLSTNDYTTTEKTKLANIEEGANNYVLPSDVVQDSKYVHTDNNYTTTEKTKLAGLSNYDDTSIKNTLNTKADKTEIPTKSSWNYDDSYVKYSAAQSLSNAQKIQARNNIGAGTSSFTGYTTSNKLSTDYINNKAGWTNNTGTITKIQVNGADIATSGTANITVPTYGTTTANLAPTASAGTATTVSRSDHVHSDRLFVTFTPTGTAIPANADLNTPTYLKVGRYYCSKTADAATIKNCPVNVAFMMEVYSPLSTEIDNETTKAWVYRLRKITHYNTGVQYIQYCNVGATANKWTYGKWYVVPRSAFTIDSSDTNGGSATVGSSKQPVYVASDGTITKCTYTLDASVPSNAVFTDTTYDDATQSAAGLMSAADKTKLDGIDSGANAYTLPTANASTLGGVKVGSNITNSSGTISLTKENVINA